MSHFAAGHVQAHTPPPHEPSLSAAARAALSRDNITLDPAAAGRMSLPLLGAGVVGLVLAIVGISVAGLKHAEASYLVGVGTVTAISLGGLFYVMAFHLTMAGWSVTIRRLFENMAALLPVCLLLYAPVVIIELAKGGVLYSWFNTANHDPVLHEKKAYLNVAFFIIRLAIYAAVWTYLSRRMWFYSTEQDRTADKWLTNKARFTSSWGMLAFALTTAFAGFDMLMSLDYRFFSTMWGVYFFAGAALSSMSLAVVLLAVLKGQGKLKSVVTPEHVHDMGKLILVFTIFWAYIGFSQYFLIWYSNIPEETAYYVARKSNGWAGISAFLAWGHFLGPFFILLWKRVKRTANILALMACWMIFMEVVDMFWIVRPMVYAGAQFTDHVGYKYLWVDAVAIIGVLGIYLGLLVRRLGQGPLVPTKDPRLPEAMEHMNYV
jgi:hypothetical protein